MRPDAPSRLGSARARRWSLRRCLSIVAGAATLVGLTAFLLGNWDAVLRVPPTRLVTVYRTHGCRCVFEWTAALKAQGFTVRLFEYETLSYVRRSLNTPSYLQGCHVAAYLDYFVEGHVSTAALRALAEDRPSGLGLTTEETMRRTDAHPGDAAEARSRVLLIEPGGKAIKWFEPKTTPKG